MANIISLTVENFRSYKEETTFTFEAIDANELSGNYHDVNLKNGETIRLLNSAVIYGANAAGKSTIIIALWALITFVRASRDYDPNKKIPYEPYIFSSKTKDSPIKLKLDFIVNEERYIYSITYNQMSFIEEVLFNKTQDEVLFNRKEDGVVKFNTNLLPEFKQIRYLKNHLALSKLSLEANKCIQTIYKELSSITTLPLLESRNIWGNTQEIASYIHKKPESRVCKIIKDLIVLSDTDIVGVNVSKNDLQLPESWSDVEKKIF